MEERTIDNEREVKIKRKKGGDDFVDALAEENGEPEGEEEFVLDFAEGDDYDEDLVGLTPEELRAELERREKAKREAAAAQKKLVQEGKEKLKEKRFSEAEVFFAQALVYGENEEAAELLWQARTENFASTAAFYRKKNAEELAAASEGLRAFVMKQSEETLKAEWEQYRKEAIPLEEKVEKAIEERRAPFEANKKYYAVRFRICLGALFLCCLWAIISGSFIYSTEGMLPVWLTVAAGVCALVSLGFCVFFAAKLRAARLLCRENEKLSSTPDGARLEEIQNRLQCLKIIFHEETV